MGGEVWVGVGRARDKVHTMSVMHDTSQKYATPHNSRIELVPLSLSSLSHSMKRPCTISAQCGCM